MPLRVHSQPRILSGPQLPVFLLGILVWSVAAQSAPSVTNGMASWYGEAHRGRVMANGQPFNPDRLTAASWFYPLETKLIVTSKVPGHSVKRVMVTVTDRGPAHRLVNDGRIIDLSRAAFAKLGSPALGLVEVSVRPERQVEGETALAAILPWLTNETSLHRAEFCAIQGSGKPEYDGASVTPAVEQKKLP